MYAERAGIYFDRSYLDSGLAPWEDAALEDYFSGCERILVAAAGSGREVLALAERGFHADGFDCATDLVQAARERLAEAGHDCRVWCTEPDTVPAGLPYYDGVVVGCGALSHIPGRPIRVAFLQQLRALLRSGAPLLVSYQSVLGRGRQLRLTYWTAELVRHLGLARRSPEFGDALPTAFVHYFGPTDVQHELDLAGFRILRVQEGGISHAIAHAEAP